MTSVIDLHPYGDDQHLEIHLADGRILRAEHVGLMTDRGAIPSATFVHSQLLGCSYRDTVSGMGIIAMTFVQRDTGDEVRIQISALDGDTIEELFVR